jgi:hypothetical protein
MKKYVVTYQKTKFLHIDVEAKSQTEAIEKADDTDEKFGTVVETPYFVVKVSEEKDKK